MTENDDILDILTLDLDNPVAEPALEPDGSSRALAEAVRQEALDTLARTRKRVSAKRAFTPGAIHQIRVACKRLRAMWQLVRPLIEPPIAQEADERLGARSALLARSRDTHVLEELLTELRDSDEALYRGTFDRAAILLDRPESVEFDQESTRTALLEALDRDRDAWRLLVLPDDEALVDHGLDRTYRKAWRRGETAARTGSGADNHRWRKWTKYLRYQLECLGEPGTELEHRITGLTALGSSLGKRNDLHNLRSQLEQRKGGDPFGAVFRAIDLRDQALARRIEGVAKTLYGPAPEEMTATLRRELERDD